MALPAVFYDYLVDAFNILDQDSGKDFLVHDHSLDIFRLKYLN